MLAFVCEMIQNEKCGNLMEKEVDIKLDADRKEWFCDRDVCEILSQENVKKALYEQVKQLCKSKLKDIKVAPSEGTTLSSHNVGKAIYNPA